MAAARKSKERQKKVTRRPQHPQRDLPSHVGKTIAQFCRDYDIGRATFFKWRQQGLGPAIMQPAGPRGRVVITPEAEAAWKVRHTALAPAAG
jgi:hypothetical protein